MSGFIKKIFIKLLTSIVVFLSNQKSKTQPTLFNLHSNEYI